ncbi:MAG: UV radiation resistance protein and autophagy-related subunit 14-domain-containing protein [Linnemannia elongata]|nr:MAG: UV radiation resistance protein and autophagy-related subunit 14-domain-containing protein [Linnemannia elongata]
MDERQKPSGVMECGICHLQGSRSYTCVNCVHSALIQHWEEMRTSTEERDQLAAHVNQVLSPKIKRHQMCLAERAMAAEHASTIAEERKTLLTELEQDRQKLMRLRSSLSQRKETLKLSMARFQVAKMNGPPAITNSVNRITEHWASVHQKLGHSRRVLVAEVVTLFDLKNVPERRRATAASTPTTTTSTGGSSDLNQSSLSNTTTLTGGTTFASTRHSTKKSTKLRVRDYLEEDSWNEFLIVGRPLPTGYFENYDRDEINTTIENVIHMTRLVACYLGVKLPFETFLKKSQYYIHAAMTAGAKRAPLYLTEGNLMPFTVGLAHLNYNIAYLCHSQGVHITLAKAPNTLENLLACCNSPNLGRYTNYATMMTRRRDGVSEPGSTADEVTSPVSPSSDESDYDNIHLDYKSRSKRRSSQVEQQQASSSPGHDQFDLKVEELVAIMQGRQDEESAAFGGVHIQTNVASHLRPLPEYIDEIIMHEDQEEEDGMYTFTDNVGGGGNLNGAHGGSNYSSESSTANSANNGAPIVPRTSTSEAMFLPESSRYQRRSPHPSRDRSRSYSQKSEHGNYPTSGNGGTGSSSNGSVSNSSGNGSGEQGEPENWTFLDVDIFRVPSSVNRGSSLLSGRGWPDMSVLKRVGSAVGGAAAGLVNGAASMSPAVSQNARRRFMSTDSGSNYPTISSSAPP